jgi:hypothetical protein
MAMILKREQNSFNFLEEFHIATTSQIRRLFYYNTSDRYCRQRLYDLYRQGFLKRTRSTTSNEYAYYLDKRPGQIHHDLIRVELYINLRQRYNVLDWQNESPVGHTRPDALALVGSDFAFVEDNGIIFPIFVEIHLNNKFNFDKYKQLLKDIDLRGLYKVMPRVIICTDQQVTVPNIGIKFKTVGFDMKGLDSIFK